MTTYIWQRQDWKEGDFPAFQWDSDALRPQLERITLQQGRLLGKAESVPEGEQEAQLDALIQTALRTSEIEGEMLNVGSVRSSVVRHLGLDRAGVASGRAPETPQSRALVQLLVEATANHQNKMDLPTLCQWQAALFPVPPVLNDIHIGSLRGDAFMQVLSGPIGKPVVHFEAPPREGLENEIERFFAWFNCPPGELNGFLRAGVAHLWLLTLHPFDDGNGRVTRAVTDRALAQSENNSARYYSLSAAIMARRAEYYEQLEAAQKGTLDITDWLCWFLSVLDDAIAAGSQRFQRVIEKTRFWHAHGQTALSERQIKVLNRLLDTQGDEFKLGINASKYMALAKVSKATATRDLAELVNKHCLVKLSGGGRSTRYVLPDT